MHSCEPGPADPQSNTGWEEMTCQVEARLHEEVPDNDWSDWLPLSELLPHQGRYSAVEVDYHHGTLRELADDTVCWDLDELVRELHNTYGLTCERFEIRVRIAQGTTHLGYFEISSDQIAEPLLKAVCASVRQLQGQADQLAGAAQRTGASPDVVAQALGSHLRDGEADALLAAHRLADEARAVLSGFAPGEAELWVDACKDGSTRIALCSKYSDLVALDQAQDLDCPIPFDHDARYTADLRDAEKLLALLHGHFTVVMPDGQPATASDLVTGSLAYSTALINRGQDT